MTRPIIQDVHTSTEKKDGFLGKLLRIFTVVLAIMTVIAAYGGVFNPAKFWYFAFTSLGFPVLFILNILMVALWLFRGRMIVWIPLLAFLLTAFKIPSMLQWNGFAQKPDFIEGQSEEIRMMSYNVRLFDLYNWSHSNATRANIMNLFEQEQPAILCLQEFYSSERKNENNLKTVIDVMNFKSYHVEYPLSLYGTDHYGIATFSQFPIINKGVLYFDKKTANVCIYTDINILTDTIRVYNCHLQSVRFGEKDYKFIESIGNSKEDEPTGEEAAVRTRNILGRLKRAFIKRSEQADLIARHIKESPYPVIICGDFNDTPTSYTYNTISKGLLDAFRESGSGFGTTYAGPIPGLRIDYILHSPVISSYEFRSEKQKLSDHFPISATIVIKR
ncbi:MAG: endonuclease/exonuclease/phosphatase family protein [Bacteroidota bacterium]|nr:endonuclease/exonuclease/phosphatase family protein [Bacteroidota bacterium]